jgi:ATP synthase protein I
LRAGRDGGRDSSESVRPMPMTEGESPPEPQDFAKRLQVLRSEVKQESGEAPSSGGVPQTAAGWVLRLSVELAAGLVVGGVIGWGLDYWLGTNPLLLIVFFLLGATAGIYNVIRSAMRLNREAMDGKDK